ncbi:hypothetical protein SISSUDRAFT_1117026 [Sistotremastrum suecicum HHB10207 ss-3]|uniref:F-box domain-containing protein n=1 Tax=Sistotremastrum suecicum HHB10207 ss-3 TaxID=1314776 RepID=A0A166H2F4_9AGAM|nr:hypothetical protein SISSUDRAFT_1117026 [Sistotremastrum suecicum HHB10207 ss-3]
MRVQPNLHNIASELILEILHEASLATLVGVAQTSTRLYNMLKETRSIWMSAPDIHDLPLPTAETLSTIPTSSLLRLAIRAVDIRRNLEAPLAIPIRNFKLSESGINLTAFLPGGDWILITHCERLWIHNLAHGAPNLDSEPIFVSTGKIQHINFESLGFGKAILVLTIDDYPTHENSPCQISILNLRFPVESSLEADPYITRIQNYALPDSHNVVAMHGPLLVISDTTHGTTGGESNNTFGIIDYQQGFGTIFSIDLPNFTDVLDGNELTPTIARIRFHPILKKLIVHVHLQETEEFLHDRRAILLFDIPTIAPLYRTNTLLKSRELLWSEGRLIPTHTYLIPDRLSESILSSRDEATVSRYIPIDEFVLDRHPERRSASETRNLISIRFDPASPDESFVSFSFFLEDDPNDEFYTHFSRDHSPYLGFPGQVQDLQVISCFNASCTRRSKIRIPLPTELTRGQLYMIHRFNPTDGRLVLQIYEDEECHTGRLYMMQY